MPGAGPSPADAERAAAYVVTRIAARAGSRLRQGARKEPLADAPLGPSLDLVASTRLQGLTQPVADALVAWGRGQRRVRLLFEVPTPASVLAWQADGERCVSLLADGVATAPHADGLAFALHDLCHLEKFVDPAHHAGQVGFFATVDAASRTPAWAEFLARFDAEFLKELEHVVADMNGSAVFLFAALKMKLKMAVRRRVARALGRAVRVHGALDAEELAAYDSELATLLDLLGLPAVGPHLALAATRINTRRDAEDAARAVLAHFESVGESRLAPAAPPR